MIVGFDKKIIVIKSPETASSSLELWFSERLFGTRFVGDNPELQPFVDGRGIATRSGHTPRLRFEIPPHTTLRGARDLLGKETFHSFRKVTSVRNPFDQVVSFFWWRLARRNPSARAKLADASEKVRKKFFSKMLDEPLPDWLRLRHYVSLDGAGVDVDNVLRYETLADDLAKLSSELFGTSVGVELPRAKSNSRPSATSYRVYYSNSDRRKVEAQFAWELETFRYSF